MLRWWEIRVASFNHLLALFLSFLLVGWVGNITLVLAWNDHLLLRMNWRLSPLKLLDLLRIREKVVVLSYSLVALRSVLRHQILLSLRRLVRQLQRVQQFLLVFWFFIGLRQISTRMIGLPCCCVALTPLRFLLTARLNAFCEACRHLHRQQLENGCLEHCF